MCGIAGWLSYDRDLVSQRDVLQRMNDTMALRGPDGAGIWVDNDIGLCHRRLSIIDLEGGRQPMTASRAGQASPVVLTYSGEVYNFTELRRQLRNEGHRFLTRSDTEVVLKSYLQWGEQFVDRLNGMYAFAVWDAGARELLLVRDRMGVKPLYYFETSDGVIFGSEPKAILAHPLVPRRVDADGLREVLEMVKTPGRSVFAGIRELQPGQLARFTPRGSSLRSYWKLEAREHEDTLERTVQHVRDLLEDIVSRQIVADVPLCSLLSGGLDSSVVTALASRKLLEQGKENIRSFSLGFADHGRTWVSNNFNVASDAPFVRALVEAMQSAHEEIVLDSADMADPGLRTRVLRALDSPPSFWGDMWPSLYRLFEHVKRRSTVALSGEAADELFGGYRWFHDPDALAENTFGWLASPTRRYFDGNALLDRGLLGKLDLPAFVRDSYAQASACVPALPGEAPINARMRRELHIHLSRCVPLMLDRKDRMSMAVGLEVRVPFCDHRLVDYAFNIPWNMHCFDGREKSILRAAAGDLLPRSILDRPKNPYPATQDPAYENRLRAALAELRSEPDAPARPLLDLRKIDQLLERGMGSASPREDRIAMELAIGLNSWLSEYEVTLAL